MECGSLHGRVIENDCAHNPLTLYSLPALVHIIIIIIIMDIYRAPLGSYNTNETQIYAHTHTHTISNHLPPLSLSLVTKHIINPETTAQSVNSRTHITSHSLKNLVIPTHTQTCTHTSCSTLSSSRKHSNKRIHYLRKPSIYTGVGAHIG